MTDGRRCCSGCGRKSSVTAGTILDRSRMSLEKWFIAAWNLTELEDGINASQLQKLLGLRSYQTAWTIRLKLCSAMKPLLRNRLHSSVVVDTAYVGIQKDALGQPTNRKFVIAVATMISGPMHQRLVAISRIPDNSDETLLRFGCDVVEPGSQVHTDKITPKKLRARGYRKGKMKMDESKAVAKYASKLKAWYRQNMTGPKPHYVDDSDDLYSVEAHLIYTTKIASDLEQWLDRMHRGAGAIAEAHFESYLDEFCFRKNYRGKNRPGWSFRCLLKSAMTTPPSRYRASRRKPVQIIDLF
jgi:hypothetical protein